MVLKRNAVLTEYHHFMFQITFTVTSCMICMNVCVEIRFVKALRYFIFEKSTLRLTI